VAAPCGFQEQSMSTLPRVLYAGTPEFAVPPLQALLAAGWPIAGVYTQPDRPAGRGRHLTASPVKACAQAAGLPVYQPADLKDAQSQVALAALQPDLFIVAAYGLLLPEPVLAAARLACINIHASLLPRWRGAAPIQRAILAGDTHTGISIMRMVRKLDAGPVYLRRSIDIESTDTAGILQQRLAGLGASALLEALPEIVAGRLAAVEQDATAVTYAPKLDKAEAVLDWSKPAVQLARQVRAFNPWPVAETRLGDARVRIWEARAVTEGGDAAIGPVGTVSTAGQRLQVATGEGALELLQLQWPGKRIMTAAEVLSGRPLDGRRFL